MNDTENEAVETEDEELPYDPDAEAEWDEVRWGEEDSTSAAEEEEQEERSDGESDDDEADQPETDEAEKSTEAETENPEAAEDTDQWIELKHMDDPPRKVSKEEAKQLAQKGLDYDRIREERDSLKANLPRYEEMEKFLKEMQGDFDSIEEFMDDTRARIKADAEGISYDDALSKVKAAKTSSKPAQQTDQADIHVQEFVTRFPNVKAEDIPASVWAEVRNTGDLVSAYEKYETSKKNDRIAELELEIETLKNNKKNAERSTGSSKSSGASSHSSLIASLWNDDD